jgi:hypothetical protein
MNARPGTAAIASRFAVRAFSLVRTRPLGDRASKHLVVGVAAGFLYGHLKTTVVGGGIRASPARNVALALAWTALAVAVDRSATDEAARRTFVSGVVLGSAWHRVERHCGE